MSEPVSRSEWLVSLLARELQNGDVVATGVASPLAILAIAAARATHAPRLTYLACVGALDPYVSRLYGSSEDLRYLVGRSAEITIPDLFDHARRGRIDTVFFGAAEVDAGGQTNMTADGDLARPRRKFPGVAGAATLRQWVRKPVLVLPRHSRRALVERVQVASTRDARRPVRALTGLCALELGPAGARLLACHPWTSVDEVVMHTGFALAVPATPEITAAPDRATLDAIRALDPARLRDGLVSPAPAFASPAASHFTALHPSAQGATS